jgi:hypothetical protein
VSSKTKNQSREAAAATQALVAEATSVAPVGSAAPAEQAADAAPVRVYSVVEPKIPGTNGTDQPAANPASAPKQD